MEALMTEDEFLNDYIKRKHFKEEMRETIRKSSLFAVAFASYNLQRLVSSFGVNSKDLSKLFPSINKD